MQQDLALINTAVVARSTIVEQVNIFSRPERLAALVTLMVSVPSPHTLPHPPVQFSVSICHVLTSSSKAI